MKIQGLSLCALFVCGIAVAGCSQPAGQSRLQFAPNVNNVTERRAGPSGYSVLYSFAGSPDGRQPVATVLDVRGTLFGTTSAGGKHCYRSSGCGTVFSLTAGGVERILYSFRNGIDGRSPTGALIDVKGTLYGTTSNGGAYGCGELACGTVFSITMHGKEKVLHNFGSGTDGANPQAGLIDVKGTLYGTTVGGGAYCHGTETCGTVFSITTSGVEKVLHSFGSGTDGAVPVAPLIEVGGTLYGTTFIGGMYGYGTVFSITPGGEETVLYSFGKLPDAHEPGAPLVDVGGTLYGTTNEGGSQNAGTVFSITTGSAETVLHSFGNVGDGYAPETAGLVDAGGTLYGTTFDGGAMAGAGTVYSITTGGVENIVHNFGYGSDGDNPLGGLIYKNGSLYGTTQFGGGPGRIGTVFSLTP